MNSTLNKSQFKTFGPRPIDGFGKDAAITATVRFDDDCGNGHNTFSITADVTTPASKRRNDVESCGCLHTEVADAFPELAPFIKWHLCSTDGPLHYVANSLYWAGQSGWTKGGNNDPPNLEHFRSTAIWPEATEEDMQNVTDDILKARLQGMLTEFKNAVESLGFVW